jgi:hypothetical protein
MWAVHDSNMSPTERQSVALPNELTAQPKHITLFYYIFQLYDIIGRY